MNIGKKIKAIRIAEGLSQLEMAQLVDIPIGTLRDTEQERTSPKFELLEKITTNKRFKKYAFWLTTDETLPESGQVAPDFSILLDCGIVSEGDAAKRA